MELKDFIRTALAVPFAPKGRDYEAWDCWGLVYCAFRDVLGIHLPSYLDEYERPGDTGESRRKLEALIVREAYDWKPVSLPKEMDLALFKIAGNRSHIGLMVDRANCLHTEAKIGTIIEPINGLVWAKRLEGVYRYVRVG